MTQQDSQNNGTSAIVPERNVTIKIDSRTLYRAQRHAQRPGAFLYLMYGILSKGCKALHTTIDASVRELEGGEEDERGER